MTKIYSILLLMFVFFSCSQHKKIQKQKKNQVKEFVPIVDKKMNELSGLMMYDNLFWGFNDSGGKNELYAFDKTGKIKRTITITNAVNIDWESIAQDSDCIYIGDFGNNSGKRKDLCIYKISKNDLSRKNKQKVKAKKICFSYSNQKRFKFDKKSTPYDCEAMFELNGELYLFSKNWRDLTTWLYRLPKKEGEYSITPIDSFNVTGLVTGADISKDKTEIALIGYNNYVPFIWCFSNFTSNDFFSGKQKYTQLPEIKNAQTEGICFRNNKKILVSCEKTDTFAQQVFVLNIK